jgi:hypothetical protein
MDNKDPREGEAKDFGSPVQGFVYAAHPVTEEERKRPAPVARHAPRCPKHLCNRA